MNPIKRLRNLWKLSEFEPRKLGSDPPPKETKLAQLIQTPAQFIPRIKKTPIEEINT